MCLATVIWETMTPIGMKVCEMIDLSSVQKVCPFGGDVFRGRQMRDQNREGGRFLGLSKAI